MNMFACKRKCIYIQGIIISRKSTVSIILKNKEAIKVAEVSMDMKKI